MNSFSSYFANLEIRKNQYQVCSIGLVSLFLFNWSFGIIIKQWIFEKIYHKPGCGWSLLELWRRSFAVVRRGPGSN